MKVKLAFLVVTLLLGCILSSTSPKLWIMRIWWFMVYHGSSFSKPLTLLYPSTSSCPRLSGGILGSDSKLCMAHLSSSEVNQGNLRSDRYSIQVYPWTAHNGGQMKTLCPSHSQLWGFWSTCERAAYLYINQGPKRYPHSLIPNSHWFNIL